ncbi:16S rRNA (cytidine(1402)-2'-O)-methyltransferase [Aliarcobacter trophiarum LMG 25534]|uniref:Ribosomal RNA small subunit methyltransferase I n=1 Tax=Aliarcobacter trophiarum LMG 25534 TaxID=1032241 RepID=A0AAD0VL88_9BACT|nr:16S rRNA (cytidine(1402)-2'-O)-methyltransferase [Aliarcobacter trophiarum]AXK47959.1 16S rRNA (cytidine(1402)-2'-O)-methyltransferase [Aliarcobacter trophiarum LMG 25534]RXI28166.1 16S rRNA (cytidine(1402)-2'-O)-methyltransferase [Aliarcobacter trophiarum]RXJ92380.1 16S rRNA (cytidine(1402)-2'-O)-methyltransferase [Aliarcobacter trophiarum LMG 25534]
MLRLVPTPIGNLDDISKRSLDALLEAELIFCEDTRVTKKLINLLAEKYELDFSNKEFKSFHSHNEADVLKTISKDTFSKNVVYCSDAGMPCISDPGATLVDWCIKNSIPYEVIPGANALLTAFAMSGFSNTEFTFFGFLDHKGVNRASKLEEVLNSSRVSILYESPHRLLKLLEELNKKEPSRTIFLVKEISKFYQRTYKNSAKNLYEELKDSDIKGEWVVVIEPKEKPGYNLELNDILPLDIAPKIKAKLIAKLTGASVKEIYQDLLGKIQN